MQPAPLSAEPAVRHIAVVGGGTAGWMSALLLTTSRFGERLKVTVLESPTVGVIGVGEGSTPWLRGFFARLDLWSRPEHGGRRETLGAL